MFYSVGIDASYSATAAVAIPGNWDCDLSRVLRPPNDRGEPTVYGTTEEDGNHAERRALICRDLVDWIGWIQRKPKAEVVVIIEAGIINPFDIVSIRLQERLAGAIEDALWHHLQIECRFIEQTTLRKLLLGRLPKEDRKSDVAAVLSALAPGWTGDQYDALTAANYGVYAEELPYLTDLLPGKADSQLRIPSAAGFCNPSELPKGQAGRNLCRQCSNECPKKQQTFCSSECVDAWKIKTQPPFARRKVHQRDGGVCADCGRACDALKIELSKLDKAERSARLVEYGYPPKAQHLWEMDHIVPVVEGGGSCDLSNLRTLCIPCHRKVTAALRARLRAKGAA